MTPRRKLLIAIGVFAVLSILAIIAAIISQVNKPEQNSTPSGEQTTSIDETSGETIIETKGKGPETLLNEGVLILGVSKLNEFGVSNQQIEIIQTAFNDYATTNSTNTKIERISLDSSNLKININQETLQTDITSEVVINQKERQKVLLSYVGTKDMLVRFYNLTTGEQTFISDYDE